MAATETLKIGLSLRRPVMTAALLAVLVFSFACASDPEPLVEDFPFLLLGAWHQVGSAHGILAFEGTTNSGIGTRMVGDVVADTFTFQWVAPATIRTNIGNEIEFTVLFEDSGDTLVLTTTPAATQDEVIRYERVK